MDTQQTRDIGSRLELFVDRWLIESLQGELTQRLHRPVPRQAALVTDRPWEGNMCGYLTVLRDGQRCRMYYKCSTCALVDGLSGPQVEIAAFLRIALAESEDGIYWQRLNLGLLSY
jgi:hypothetical protein